MENNKQVRFFGRWRDFMFRGEKFDYEEALQSYERFGSMVDVSRSKYQADAQFQFRDIPEMMKDPIVAACVASMMETAFQPTHDQALVRVTSRYPNIADTLNGWHKEVRIDDFTLLVANNIALYGNLPIKMLYDSHMRLDRFVPIADFLSVVPVVVSNRTIGYFVDGEYVDYHEYVYSQYLHYRDLGGTRNPMFKLSQRPGDTQNAMDLQNEFVLAPSYLSPAVRPWRNIKLIEDVLVLQRMDQSNFLRIVGVQVGDNVTSKNAMRLLNFYRAIFKKARRVPYDQYGMSSSSFGNEFEVVVPTAPKQGLDIKDVGGQLDIKELRDLDVQYQRLFTALRTSPSIVGFTEDTPSSLGEGPTTMWNQNHARTAKVFQYSALMTIKQIDLLYLRSRGYDVTPEDFSLAVAAASTLEEESKRKSVLAGLDVVTKALETLEKAKINYNKDYLTKELFQQAFSSSPLDMAQLFDASIKANTPQTKETIGSNLLRNDRDIRAQILVAHKVIDQTVYDTYKIQLSSEYATVVPAEGATLITSSSKKLLTKEGNPLVQRALTYDEFVAGDILASAANTFVDLSSLENILLLGDSPSRSLFQSLRMTKPALLPIKAIAVLEKERLVSARELLSGEITAISEVMIVSGRYFFEDPADLVNYLYMASSGSKDFVAKKVYVVSKTAG